MSDPAVAFIGAGNMARALIAGLLDAGRAPASLTAGDPDPAQRKLVEALGVHTTADNAAAAAGAAIVILAVKPQVAKTVVTALTLAPSQLLVSICAGVPTARLATWTRPDQPVVRCMPNTPALVRAGITALYATPAVSAAQREAAEQVLAAVGETLWVDAESDLDAVTAVSGSGPAYYFYLMEAMIDAGVALGLEREVAARLTIETAFGAARMARETGTPPAALRAGVTSQGGTTEAALAVLEDSETRRHVADALEQAWRRSKTLGEAL